MAIASDSPTRDALLSVGARDDAAIDGADAALWLARWMDPAVKIAPYRRHLAQLSEDVSRYISDDTDDAHLALEAARQVITRRYGYCGEEDEGERDLLASLARTIDRRRGNATALCLLYAHVLAAQGWPVELLDFPARTLVAVSTRTTRLIADPFAAGRILSARDLRRLLQTPDGKGRDLRPDGLAALSNRDALLALQHDIKLHHLRHAAPEAALHAIEGALLIAPAAAHLWRELGLLHARLDHLEDAAAALERFLQLPGADVHRYTASQMLQQLRQRIERERR